MKVKSILCLAFIILFIQLNTANAQSIATESSSTKKKHKTKSFYFSWGYNGEWYSKSTVSVKQSSLGNDYQLVHVVAHDHKGWNEGLFNKALTIPQYNYRLGFYFNDKQDLGIEGNFDHTKYIIADGQYVHLTGTLNNQHANEIIMFSGANGFHYYLNNGANFLLFNIVKRLGLYHTHNNKFRLDLTGKAGIGPVIPHVDDAFFGHDNDPHFQLGGWNTGVETALRATIMHYGFIEFSQKGDYARYSGLRIYDGTAKQNFGTYELILSIGVTLPNSKHNPLFVADNTATDKKQAE
jgi:hypothetical protein